MSRLLGWTLSVVVCEFLGDANHFVYVQQKNILDAYYLVSL